MAIAVALVFAGCPPPPVFDERLGVEGVPREPGSLAGTFAVKMLALNMADTPLGEVETGGMTFYLVERSWDDAEGVYRAVSRVCSVVSFETAGLTIDTPDDVARKVPETTSTVTVDHAAGTFALDALVELWALREAVEEMPTSVDDPLVYDMDEDGKPAVTLFARGVVEGEVYFVQRKTVGLSGVTTEDGALGLVDAAKAGRALDASNPLLLSESERRPHPDPKESWFFEVRLDEGADCDEVVAAREDGRLPRARPF